MIRIAKTIKEFFARQQGSDNAWVAGHMRVTFSFDDADIVIYGPTETLIEQIPTILAKLELSKTSGTLRDVPISHIQMPLDKKELDVDWTPDIPIYHDTARYWGISTMGWTTPEYVYDSEKIS